MTFYKKLVIIFKSLLEIFTKRDILKKDEKELRDLFEEGSKFITTEFDILHIIKSLRVVKSQINELKQKRKNSSKNHN